MYRHTPQGATETVVPKRRGVGGLALHADGGIVISGKDIVHVREGETRVLLRIEGVLGFNDMITDAAGRVFVGSLRSSAFESGPASPASSGASRARGTASKCTAEWSSATASVSRPTAAPCITRTTRRGMSSHTTSTTTVGVNRRVFVRLPRGNPDGLAVDEAGAVWVAMGSAGAIARFTPNGALDGILDVPASFVTSLCFGGPDRRDLYVTTADNLQNAERRGTLFRTRADVPGLPVAPARV